MRLMIGSTGLIIVIIIVVDYCYLLLLLLNYYHFYFYYYFHYFFTINNNYYIKRYIYYSSYYCDLFSNKRYLWRHAPMICCSFLALDWTLVDLVAARRRNGIQWIKTWGGGAILGRSPETPCVSHLESEQFGTKVNVSTSEKV